MTLTFTKVVKPAHLPTPQWKYEQRILNRVEVDDNGCWIWTGAVMTNGYPQIYADGSWHLLHRWAHTHWVGPIPAGYQVDHLCRQKRCCNPSHLEAVTQAENLRRQGAAVTHCPRDHEYTEANTYITSKGGRSCRECTRIRNREAKRARKTAAA